MILDDQRGSTYLETLIALPILLVGFVTMFMFARLSVAHLIVMRAAQAGVRAAVVIMPDDPAYYGKDGAATKHACVVEAVRRVLMSSPHFRTDDASIGLETRGSAQEFAPYTVRVTARYDCHSFVGSSRFFAIALCGDDRVADLSSESTLPYQMGKLQ